MNASPSSVRTGAQAIFSVGDLIDLTGRVSIAALFLVSGLSKLLDYAGVGASMSAAGVPSALLAPIIALEIFGSCALILGWRTRTVAGLLACLSLLTALIFHHDLNDRAQLLMFLKDLAITGGLLLAVANGGIAPGTRGRFGPH